MGARYLIPASSVLGLTLTAGCSDDPLVGDWGATRFDTEDGVFALPYAYTFAQNGSQYRMDFDIAMRVDDALTGTFVAYTAYTTDGETETFRTTYTLTAADRGDRSYQIALDDEGEQVVLQCALESGALVCDGGAEGGFVFERDRDGATELLDE